MSALLCYVAGSAEADALGGPQSRHELPNGNPREETRCVSRGDWVCGVSPVFRWHHAMFLPCRLPCRPSRRGQLPRGSSLRLFMSPSPHRRLEKLCKRYERGEMKKIEWLDTLTFKARTKSQSLRSLCHPSAPFSLLPVGSAAVHRRYCTCPPTLACALLFAVHSRSSTGYLRNILQK